MLKKTMYILFAAWLLILTFTQRNNTDAAVLNTMTIRGLVIDVANLQHEEVTKAFDKYYGRQKKGLPLIKEQ